jgi:riboflavin transporter FmnP
MSQNKWTVATMTKISVLAAIGIVLMLLDFPLPIFPSFLKMDASDLPALLAAFSMGPVAGVIVELLKCLLHALLRGFGQHLGIGDFANFIVGVAWVVPAAWYYQRHKTHKGAFIGMAIGTVSMVAAGAVGNWLIFLPLYAKFLFTEVGMNGIINMAHSTIPSITDMKTLIVFAFIPFNLLKSVIISLIAVFVYKPLSPLLHK